jgi:hypothetical protein
LHEEEGRKEGRKERLMMAIDDVSFFAPPLSWTCFRQKHIINTFLKFQAAQTRTLIRQNGSSKCIPFSFTKSFTG